MNSPNKDLDQIKKKLNELDERLKTTVTITMSYLTALMDILEEKGVASKAEIIKQIDEQKVFFKSVSREVEFQKMMRPVKRSIKKRRKKDK